MDHSQSFLGRITEESQKKPGEPERRVVAYHDDKSSLRVSSLGALNRYGEGGAGPDQLTSFGGERLRYDAAGRLVEDGTRRLAWDAKGRLARVDTKKGWQPAWVSGDKVIEGAALGGEYVRVFAAGRSGKTGGWLTTMEEI